MPRRSARRPSAGSRARRSPEQQAEVEKASARAAPAVQERPQHTPPFLVAGVGASAGGLEAFAGLLRAVPADAPLALLLVQHLAAARKSALPALLGHSTALVVEPGRDGLPIRPGHVYVIPPSTELTVLDGHMVVRERPGTRTGAANSVDVLFHSIAEHYGERAVGVVLSGSARDGAAGIRSIRAAGGITMAQIPDEAAVDGMPRAAIESGAVDLVLPVEQIAEELVRLSRQPAFLRDDAEADVGADEAEIRKLFQLLRRHNGVDFHNYKSPTIRRRIRRRMALQHVGGVGEYAARLEADPEELHRLSADLLIHVTSFFREASSFEALRDLVLAPALTESRDEPFRVWVPACSTGEEVYSTAMLILECLGDRADSYPLQIFGTDVSESTVERARAAIYPPTIAQEVNATRLRRFFTAAAGGFRVNKAIRDRCVFARQDVTRDPPFSKIDLIVCRNLLIYLTQSSQKKVLSLFHYALKPTGVLMLGRSESVSASGDLFSAVDKKAQIYRRQLGGRSRADLTFATRSLDDKGAALHATPGRTAATPSPRAREPDPLTEASRFLVDAYAPPSVVTDGELRIVRTRGDTSDYLQLPSGDASLDLLKMARPELQLALRALLKEAKAKRRPVTRDRLRLRLSGKPRLLTVQVVPLGSTKSRQWLISFDEAAPGGRMRPRRGVEPAPELRGSRRVVAALEAELGETRQQLQSIIDDLNAANEELQSANEEVLSSNEELQSTNEELDTAKEELQSTNEELSTVNDELQARNEDLLRANSDLLNLLASVQIPIVMVSRDLRIRTFTPAAEKVLNIISSDVGRPIGHLKPNLVGSNLDALIAQVIETAQLTEREVEGLDGRIFAMQIRPYQSLDNRIDGAVLALFDVTAARNQAAALRLAQQTGEAIMSTVRDPIVLLDAELRVRAVNRSFGETFGLRAEEAIGQLVYDLGSGEWASSELRPLLESILPKKRNFEGFEVTHDFPRLGRRRMLLDGRSIQAGNRGGVILLLIRDVTTREP